MTNVETKTKEKQGKVIKISGKDTVAVQIEGLKRHTLYGKVMKTKTKYLVHDAGNKSKIGDLVAIIEGRPLSKLKRWTLKTILQTVAASPVIEVPEPTTKAKAKVTVKKGAKKKS